MAVSMACWSEGVRPLLRTAVGPVSAGDAGIAYTASLFGRQVLPVGAGAGPVITAFAIDRESALSYDETLAVVTVAEFVSTVASLALAAAGLLWLAWTGSFDADLWLVAALLLGFAGLLAAAATFVWYRRSAVCRGNERAVFHSYLYHQFGWVFVAIPLSVSAVALGVPLPFGLVCFVVPTSLTVEVLPLPGGLGGVEMALAGLLVVLGGLDVAGAAAVVFLYRLCTSWFVLVVGDVTALYSSFGVRNVLERPRH